MREREFNEKTRSLLDAYRLEHIGGAWALFLVGFALVRWRLLWIDKANEKEREREIALIWQLVADELERASLCECVLCVCSCKCKCKCKMCARDC